MTTTFLRSPLILLTALFLMIAAPAADAQEVTVRSRKAVYKRSGKNIPEYKRTFEINYPVISGRISPAAKRAISRELDYWRVFEMSLAENLRDDHWLSSFDFKVNYNGNGILDIWLIVEGVGAYPDGDIRYMLFDLRTGKRQGLADLFRADRMDALLQAIRDLRRIEEEREIAASPDFREALEMQREAYAEYHPPPDKLEFKHLDGFSISDAGVTFHAGYGFPHVIESLEPAGEYFISYTDLKPFLRPQGLLGRFIR